MIGFLIAAAAATAPVPSMTTDWWSDYYDTPTQGIGAGELSMVVAEMTVNTYGAVTSCVGHVYVGNPQMGPYVCSRLQKRAEFSPARGPDGHKMIGVYRKLISVANVRKETRFAIPKFGIQLPDIVTSGGDNPFEIQFFLDASGTLSDCSLVDSVGINAEKHKQVVDPSSVQHACAAVETQLKPQPPRDRHGAAQPSVQNAIVMLHGPSLNIQNQ